MNKIVKKVFNKLAVKGFFNWVPDKLYLKIRYNLELEKRMNLKNPQTFNEKLQWLKLNNKNELYTKLVDKYEVREYIKEKIGEKYLIPLIGIYNTTDEIDFSSLPQQFVMKCTHDSGGLVICEDKETLKMHDILKKINKWMKKNYFYWGREWPYKNVKPRIIIEEYMGKNLLDYKFFCFHGKVKTILVCSNRTKTSKNTDFYDKDWNHMPFTRQNYTRNKEEIEKPKKLKEMIEIAEVLSKEIPFVRVDLYEIDNKVFFGELTFYPSSGFEGFLPNKYDEILGDWLELERR